MIPGSKKSTVKPPMYYSLSFARAKTEHVLRPSGKRISTLVLRDAGDLIGKNIAGRLYESATRTDNVFSQLIMQAVFATS